MVRIKNFYGLNDAIGAVQYLSGRVINYGVDDAGRVNKVWAGTKIYANMTPEVVPAPQAPYTADGRISEDEIGERSVGDAGLSDASHDDAAEAGNNGRRKQSAGVGLQLLGDERQWESPEPRDPAFGPDLDPKLWL